MRHVRISAGGRLAKDRGPSKAAPVRGQRSAVVRCRGLGDLVEAWARPVARWIDGRHPIDPVLRAGVLAAVRVGLVTLPLAGCSACSRRRRWLNRLVPQIRSWRAWAGALQRLCKAPR